MRRAHHQWRPMRFIALVVCSGALSGVAEGQQNFERPQTLTKPAELPSSVAIPAAKPVLKPSQDGLVLFVPENDIFKGVDLTDAQRKALSANLKAAEFRAKPTSTLTAMERQMMLVPGSPTRLLQWTPGPGGLGIPNVVGDPCALIEVSDEQIAAMRKLIAAHLSLTGGDAIGFEQNMPTSCRRQQVVYFMKSARAVVK